MNKKTLDENNPRDYLDAFLIKIEKEKTNPESEFHLTNLVNSTLQKFFAGVDTISTTLTYSLLLLMKYPDVLAKVHKEIDKVIGRDRCPKIQDRNCMPFTDAVIHEIQHFIDLVPMGAPRKTTRDIIYRGYSIPKNTNVYPMLSSVLKDPTCFPYPNEFNPKNFLDENGQFKKNDAFIPLATGVKSLVGRGNLPPGPMPLPLLGNALDIGVDLVNSLMKLREKYGDVFMVYLGSRPVVVVTGYNLVKEIYLDKGDDYLNRGSLPAWHESYRNHGFIFTNNMERWRELRRFSLSALRDFGFGKRSIEDMIQEETRYLLAELKKSKESFLDPHRCLSRALCNIIFSIMFGNRFEYEDKNISTALVCIYKSFLIANSSWGQMYDMFPGVMKFIPGPHQKIVKLFNRFTQFASEKVKNNQMTLDPNNPRDYVDAFLIKLEKEKANPNTEFNMKNLLACTLQIFFAGIETIGTSMTYCLLILLKYPDVLAKVHKEIDHVIGPNRSPTLQDRNHMPYTKAVIHEMQRFIDLTPMGLPRKTTKEVKIKGYTVPKDTDVFPMITSVLKDPTCFKYPNEFNPENFLNEKGEFQKNKAFIPLAAGKRTCLGEALVQMELFLFLVTILQNFDLKSQIPVEELDITPIATGLGNIPKPYKIAFILQ